MIQNRLILRQIVISLFVIGLSIGFGWQADTVHARVSLSQLQAEIDALQTENAAQQTEIDANTDVIDTIVGQSCSPGQAFVGIDTSGVFICEPFSRPNTIKYSEDFVAGTAYNAGTPQYDNWSSFVASLDTSIYNFATVTFSGSNDPTVFECSDPAIVAQIADALRLGSVFNGICDGQTWDVKHCGSGQSLGVSTSNSCQSCSDLYTIRPHIENDNWGGFNSRSCPSGPDQTLTLIFNH